MEHFKPMAEHIAYWIMKRSVHKGKIPETFVKDICDLQTDSQLDFIELNILTGMVIAKLPKESVKHDL